MSHLLRLCLLVSIFLIGGGNNLYGQSLENLLDTLDLAIANYDVLKAKKESRILALQRQLASKRQPADRYAVQTLLYDEYHVYDADSALAVCDRQLHIAEMLQNADWQSEWHVKRSFILAAMGLLADADAELQSVEVRSHLLPTPLRTEYFRQRIYIYSHRQQYLGTTTADNAAPVPRDAEADILLHLYNDSIMQFVSKDDPLYLWQMAWSNAPLSEKGEIKMQLQKRLSEGNLNDRFDAMNAYSLAHIFELEGNDEDRLRALAMSAIADVRYCNHDIASIEELARLLYEKGDLERPYGYINYCLASAIAFHNRVRMVSTSAVFGQIHAANVERQHVQRIWLTIIFVLVIAFALALAVAVLQLATRVRRIRKGEHDLAEANASLQHVNGQLKEMVEKNDVANSELSEVNHRLSEVVGDLRESNYVKEETVGLAFTLCSGYITQFDDQRKTFARLLKTNQIDLLHKQLEHSQSNEQLKAFFRNFDQLFLNIYPDFIDDFNSLLRPEEHIVPKDGDLLNTELRIYALVRLGINDSVKIAEFLHCSPQTVYNHRLKVRNKSDIPNSEFAATVQRLGKASL